MKNGDIKNFDWYDVFFSIDLNYEMNWKIFMCRWYYDYLKARDRNIAIHRMTQILEKEKIRKLVNFLIAINQTIQF